jgi:hypothetical protein
MHYNIYHINDIVGSDVSVTTDDVIPFLAYIVILCQPKHLKTNLFYMEHLTAVNLSTNQIGYANYLRDKLTETNNPGYEI